MPGSAFDAELPHNFTWIKPDVEGATLVETHLSSSEVRLRLSSGESRLRLAADDQTKSRGGRRGSLSADDVVRAILKQGSRWDWYSEIEGLVPLSVVSYMKRYGLYGRKPVF